MPLQPAVPDAREWTALVEAPIELDPLVAWATTAGDGAVVAFLGVVRDHAEGRTDVAALTYEAYEEPALRRLDEIVDGLRADWPAIDRVVIVHRLGRLALSDTAVVVVVSSPHRAEAFAAAQAAIDRVKASVPIWKQEHWAEGSDWGTGAQPIRAVAVTAGTDVACSS